MVDAVDVQGLAVSGIRAQRLWVHPSADHLDDGVVYVGCFERGGEPDAQGVPRVAFRGTASKAVY